MKIIYASLIFLLSTQLLADELEWVDKQITAIQPLRIGLSKSIISSIKSPFIKARPPKDSLKKKKKKELNLLDEYGIETKVQVTYKLSAILNKTALIDGKWYKLHDKLHEYKITSINSKSVTLGKKGKSLILSTMTKNNAIHFINN